MRATLCLLFFLLFSLSIMAQEDLYIEYNSENGDVYFEGKDRIRFYLRPRIDASYYIYDKEHDDKKEANRDQIAEKLVSKTKTNQMAKAVREKQSRELEKETGIKGQPPREILFFRTFDGMYIFVPDSTGEKGVLYPVSWRYGIE